EVHLVLPNENDTRHERLAKKIGLHTRNGSLFFHSCLGSYQDEFAPPKFFASIHRMEHDQLFTEFNVRVARQISLSVEVRMRAEYNIKEKEEAAEAIRLCAEAFKFEAVKKSLQYEVKALKERNTTLEKENNDLDVKVTDLAALVVVREREVADLDALVTFVKSHNDNLVDQVHELDISSFALQEKVWVYENCMDQLEKFQDEWMKTVSDRLEKMDTDFVEMTLHLEEKFYPHLLTTISGRRWLLTHGMELIVTKCLNSPEYLFALETAISKAIEKGMQDGLAAGITHGKEGRVLTDVVTHNPSAEVDYVSALQQLQSVTFPLLAELESTKDASVETVMDILRLENSVAKKLGLNELIRENIVNRRSTLYDVFVPLAEPSSVAELTGAEGTSSTVPSTVSTTTALSITLAFASLIAPISTDDYKVVGTDDQTDANGNAALFPNVDDAELNIP
nr:hypothetical protein [Tanacetum cinerariifolium]